MDKKAEKETHDFMNVDSFSQLPFNRPAAPPAKEKAIKLFGIEFEVDNDYDGNEELLANKESSSSSSSSSSSNRRFECHYCCRKFPTSQALGGHQNAHKRERQHAKRMLCSSSSSSRLSSFYRNHYPTWNSGTSFTQQPINGSPLTLWRTIPTPAVRTDSIINRDRSLLQPLPLFAGDDKNKLSLQVSGSSQGRFGVVEPQPSPTVQDHVSLDLHL